MIFCKIKEIDLAIIFNIENLCVSSRLSVLEVEKNATKTQRHKGSPSYELRYFAIKYENWSSLGYAWMDSPAAF